MRVLVCIDDTDNLETKRGTGELASEIAGELEKRGWGKAQPVTRHQLLVHPDIPYTSHNSCMCFDAEIKEEYLNNLIGFCEEYLVNESAPGSDPGLCVVVPDRLSQPGWLISFGFMAKREVLTKEDAYSLAEELNVHLSEHGGTGQGVIGALAGTGLRLSGNDGRFRGKIKIKEPYEIATVDEICSQSYVEIVKSLDEGIVLAGDERVRLGEVVKAALMDGKSVLLVNSQPEDEVKWQTCSKNQIKNY